MSDFVKSPFTCNLPFSEISMTSVRSDRARCHVICGCGTQVGFVVERTICHQLSVCLSYLQSSNKIVRCLAILGTPFCGLPPGLASCGNSWYPRHAFNCPSFFVQTSHLAIFFQTFNILSLVQEISYFFFFSKVGRECYCLLFEVRGFGGHVTWGWLNTKDGLLETEYKSVEGPSICLL